MILVYMIILLSILAGGLGLFLMFCSGKRFKLVRLITFIVLGLDLLAIILTALFEDSLSLT